MTARVAIVMRTKNRPLLLRRAIASVAAQRYTDYSLVIVNDAGEAGPVVELIEQAPQSVRDRIVFVDNKVSAGREGAMNVGIEAVDSEFIIIHDDDDTWAPGFLEATVAYLDEHPEAGGVNARTEVIFERIEGDSVVEERRDMLAADKHQVSFVDVMQHNYIVPIGFLYRRSVYDEVGPIDGSLPVLGDWEFTLRFLARYPIGFVDGAPLAFWHQRASATGDLGNSVVVEAGEHRDYDSIIRDDYLRRSLRGEGDLGTLLAMAAYFDRMEQSSVKSRQLAAEQAAAQGKHAAEGLEVARVSVELAIGRLEERQLRLEQTLDRISNLLEFARPMITLSRKAFTPAIKAGQGIRAAQRSAKRGSGAPDGAPGGAPTAKPDATTRPTAAVEGSSPRASGDTTPPAAPRTAGSTVARALRDRDDTRVTGRPMKRVAFYLFFDPDGQVDDYVLYKLEQLREHVEHIFVVSNGPLSPAGRERLEPVADTVWERENVGFDVWGYKEAQERFGWERLAEYDELILLNYTFFGPIFPFGELFDRMDAADVDFWGITEHDQVDPHPHHGVGVMPRHIQSHWIAVRRQMFLSDEYRAYWRDMPMITSYDESIDRHEARFLVHFESLGFVSQIAFPLENYPSAHPIFDDIVLMLRDRLPIVKRRLFFHDPLYLDRFAIIARDAMAEIERSGYPSDLIWRNIVRGAKPRVLATNLTLNEVLPEHAFPDADPRALDRSSLPSVAVVCHLYYDDLVGEILDSVATIPGDVDLYITTTDDEKRARIEDAIAASGFAGLSDVRVIESNRGRDISAFVVGCADVLRNEKYELIVKIHGKKSAQDGYNIGTWFKRHLIENLLASPGYTENLVALFQRQSTLGMVFPPVIHMGYPTMGHAWFANKEPAKKFAKRLGITVPFDDTTPLSAYGSMFVARRSAIAQLAELGLTWDDFPAEGGYKDGTLAHVIERMFSYVALGNGYHVRTVMSPEMAAINYSFLEYKYQAVSAYLPAYGIEQVPYLEATSGGAAPSPLALAKRMVAGKPAVANALRPVYQVARRAFRRVRPK